MSSPLRASLHLPSRPNVDESGHESGSAQGVYEFFLDGRWRLTLHHNWRVSIPYGCSESGGYTMLVEGTYESQGQGFQATVASAGLAPGWDDEDGPTSGGGEPALPRQGAVVEGRFEEPEGSDATVVVESAFIGDKLEVLGQWAE